MRYRSAETNNSETRFRSTLNVVIKCVYLELFTNGQTGLTGFFQSKATSLRMRWTELRLTKSNALSPYPKL